MRVTVDPPILRDDLLEFLRGSCCLAFIRRRRCDRDAASEQCQRAARPRGFGWAAGVLESPTPRGAGRRGLVIALAQGAQIRRVLLVETGLVGRTVGHVVGTMNLCPCGGAVCAVACARFGNLTRGRSRSAPGDEHVFAAVVVRRLSVEAPEESLELKPALGAAHKLSRMQNPLDLQEDRMSTPHAGLAPPDLAIVAVWSPPTRRPGPMDRLREPIIYAIACPRAARLFHERRPAPDLGASCLPRPTSRA
jgi:hypothetical protein